MNRLNTENINGLVSIYADNLATAKFDADTSGNIYGTSLYINNQVINFASYVTSSYLSSNYALISSLSNYVLASTLSSTLSGYATTAALSSYRLISDSYNKSETQSVANNAASSAVATAIATGGAVTAAIALNNIPVYAAIATAQATADGAAASATTANNNATDAQGRCSTLEGKTQNQTATAGNTNFTGTLKMLNGLNTNVTLNQTGDISCLTETLNTLTCNTELKGNGKLNLANTQDHILTGNSISLSQSNKNTIIYGNSYIGAAGSTVQLYGSNININNSNSITEFNTVTIGGLVQTVNINGYVFINGRLITGFGIGATNGQWSFPNT
jgi:hypothetical protein